MRKLALLMLLLASCSRRSDNPFTTEFIEHDLKSRSTQDLYDAAKEMTYVTPEDGLLTEKQLSDYARMKRLAKKIREVAEGHINRELDSASQSSGLSRAGAGFAAMGSYRAYATSELRAALNLHLNPAEEEWVARQVMATVSAVTILDKYDDEIASNQDSAVQHKDWWVKSQDATVLANAELIRAHREELKSINDAAQ